MTTTPSNPAQRCQPTTDSADTRTVHDPFLGKDVQVGDKLTDRLRGRYAMGPHLPNGRPEFGFRQFQAPPIQHEAARAIESLSISNAALVKALEDQDKMLAEAADILNYARSREAMDLGAKITAYRLAQQKAPHRRAKT